MLPLGLALIVCHLLGNSIDQAAIEVGRQTFSRTQHVTDWRELRQVGVDLEQAGVEMSAADDRDTEAMFYAGLHSMSAGAFQHHIKDAIGACKRRFSGMPIEAIRVE